MAVPPGSADLSSQEEYEESESESDRVMTSSNEAMDTSPLPQEQDNNSDDDENRTAVNYPIRRSTIEQAVFTPPPNAFSHPPHSHTVRHASEPGPTSYFPQLSPRHDRTFRHSFSSQEPRSRLSPSRASRSAAHHEAALRASLSTLLSCAAAARALPKPRTVQQASAAPAPPRQNRIDPTSLRLIPESALPAGPAFAPTLRPRSSSTTSSQAQPPRRAASKDRPPRPKQQRRASSASSAASYDDPYVSPTLLTWVVSAGVVVALSAISFSAGYAVGKEAGRIEGLTGVEGSCASEVGRGGIGLRRLRFTAQA